MKAIIRSTQFRNWTLALALAGFAGAAHAAITIDENGVGFVGKGDVQLLFDWNNAQLQANAENLLFRLSAYESVSWTCDRDAGPQTQTRTRTTSLDASIAYSARVKNQVTGFNLTGYFGEPVEETDGPAYHSCPTGWSVDGDDVVTSGDVTLEVSVDGVNWLPLQITE